MEHSDTKGPFTTVYGARDLYKLRHRVVRVALGEVLGRGPGVVRALHAVLPIQRGVVGLRQRLALHETLGQVRVGDEGAAEDDAGVAGLREGRGEGGLGGQ